MSLTILLTGGGTAGHAIPNIALIQHLKESSGSKLLYVGSKLGIEKSLIQTTGIPYYAISTAKLRRHLSWRNLLIPGQLLLGVVQSLVICCRHKPQIVFSKGGFVACPVVIAAWLCRVPIVIHESDLTPGLSNRLSIPFARLVCITFPITRTYIAHKKEVVLTGLPIRNSLSEGNAAAGLTWLGFKETHPVLLIWGGSLGAVTLNESVRRLVPALVQSFQIVHLCGQGKTHPDFSQLVGYRQFEYLDAPLANVIACADLVVSRAGATAIYELLMLKKPHILCPLSKKVSRGDQIHNAQYLESLGLSQAIYPEDFNDTVLLEKITDCYQNLDSLKKRLAAAHWVNGTALICQQLSRLGKGS